MADNETYKVIGNVWASRADADRNDPEDFGIVRTEGWPIAYEQLGGAEPEREVFNQKFREWDGFLDAIYVSGLPSWDARVDYDSNAQWSSFVLASDGFIYVAAAPSGPTTGNATDPVTPGNTLWNRY